VTVLEQLARQVAAIRTGTTATTRMVWNGSQQGNLTILAGEITLTCRCDTLRKSVTNNIWGRVNAAEAGGAEAGHLLVISSRSWVETQPDGSLAYWLAIRLMYGDRPWNPPSLSPCPYPEVDFDALLAALEPVAMPPDVPPDRAETWHDRPPLL
jgi:hypothetical protein